MINRFTDINVWRTAVAQRNLTIIIYADSSGPSPDDLWEPSWAVQMEDGFLYDDSPMFGCFQNIPTDEKGTSYTSEGFLCDTEEEFIYEMHEDDKRHDALNEKDISKPTMH